MHALNHMALAALVTGITACASAPTTFPTEAQPITAKALQERLTGRAFTGRTVHGTGWDVRYEANGRFNMTVSNGTADSGRWRTEDNRLCVEFEGKFPSSCSEVRAADGQRLYLKRGTTGEVVILTAKP